ncbi:hypothetical protein GQ53DRAFT_771431 [Thozetella sp. PMI_491]|nr:hypothetical protein GQ53DRAFT_771431 [Thozetella sp. PMI_491]
MHLGLKFPRTGTCGLIEKYDDRRLGGRNVEERSLTVGSLSGESFDKVSINVGAPLNGGRSVIESEGDFYPPKAPYGRNEASRQMLCCYGMYVPLDEKSNTAVDAVVLRESECILSCTQALARQLWWLESRPAAPTPSFKTFSTTTTTSRAPSTWGGGITPSEEDGSRVGARLRLTKQEKHVALQVLSAALSNSVLQG